MASAAPLTATIHVQRAAGAESCPDADALTGKVERILQRTLSAPGSASDSLEVEVRFGRDEPELFAEVRSLGAKPGERKLRDRGRSCAALGEAVSVAIALLLDTELERRNEESAAAAVAETPSTPSPDAPARPVAVAPENPGPIELRATLEGGALSGVVSSTSALLSEQLGVRVYRHLVLDAGFNALLPSSTQFGAGSVRTTLLFASLRACYTWGQNISVGPCAQVGAGRLRGVGLDYASVQSVDLLWTAWGLGVVAEGPVWGRVFWGAYASAWLPTRTSTFSVENQGTAWESSPVAAGLSARLGFRVW